MTDRRAPEPLIEASGVSLAYGSRAVLSGVDLAVRAGEFWFFVGPNGSGKTTLVRSFLGLLPPREGSLRRAKALAGGVHVGFVPQRSRLAATVPTTVREFVSWGAAGSPFPASRRRENLAWALDKTRLADLARRDYWALSEGQRQRALLARALVRRPALLILDEPTTGLDLPTEDALLRLLEELNREGLAVILVTHDLSLAARSATHAVLFSGGTARGGAAGGILTPDNLQAAFGVRLAGAAETGRE